MTGSPEFLIDSILPAHEVHLLGGSSGSGKTTLVFQTLAEWQQGQSVFNHDSYPVPYVYASLDRSRSSVTRTLQRLGLESTITRIVCQEELPDHLNTISEVIPAIAKLYPDAKFFVLEGFQTLVGEKGNSYAPVASLLKKSAKICSKQQITILGIAHSPKMKLDESFKHSRELILGSVAWGAYSDTIITVQLEEATGNITVNVSPRNAASETFHYVFGHNGVLVPLANVKPKEAIKLKIEALSPGCSLLRAEVLRWAAAYNVSDKTGDRVITECLKNKVLDTIDAGIYERTNRHPIKIVEDFGVTVES